jgi:hypothetical protein
MSNHKISHIDSDRESELNLFDPQNPDIKLFNLMDDELIKLSGSKMYYYKYYPSKEHDDVYEEEQVKAISEHAIIVFGHYDPKAIEENLGKFGLVQESDQIFTFNIEYIKRKIGRLPIAGDIVEPQFQKIKFKIFEVQEDGFESYGKYHAVCSAKVLRGSEHIIGDVGDNTKIGNVD